MLRIGASQDAVWGYLAVAGGFAVPPELGSVSTHVRSGLRGIAGRALIEGDALPLGHGDPPGDACAPENVLYARERRSDGAIRVVLGPQEDHFDPLSLRTFPTEAFIVTHRMGCNLLGPALRHARGADVVSDGILAGSVQVPGSGQLIALLADCQPTGGYPKIATVLSADVGRLVQKRPGAAVRFQAVTVEDGRQALTEFLDRIERLSTQLMAAIPGSGPRN